VIQRNINGHEDAMHGDVVVMPPPHVAIVLRNAAKANQARCSRKRF
jgi:hypothetical protein